MVLFLFRLKKTSIGITPTEVLICPIVITNTPNMILSERADREIINCLPQRYKNDRYWIFTILTFEI